jgi:hypothetical protein
MIICFLNEPQRELTRSGGSSHDLLKSSKIEELKLTVDNLKKGFRLRYLNYAMTVDVVILF